MLYVSSGRARGEPRPAPRDPPISVGNPGGRATGAVARVAVTFEDAVREHEEAVYGAALRILADRELARDAAGQAFAKAYRSWGSYDPARPIRPWLLRIAVNEAITLGRARARQRAHLAPDTDPGRIAGGASSPEGEALDRESAHAVRSAVARLPERYRVVVVLRYFGELSVDEVAAATGRSASTVGVQLLRARQLLRKAMGDRGV